MFLNHPCDAFRSRNTSPRVLAKVFAELDGVENQRILIVWMSFGFFRRCPVYLSISFQLFKDARSLKLSDPVACSGILFSEDLESFAMLGRQGGIFVDVNERRKEVG